MPTTSNTSVKFNNTKKRRQRLAALVAWEQYQTTGLHVTASEADKWLAKLEAGKDASPPTCHD